MRLIAFPETATQWIELAARGLEILAVLIITGFIAYASLRYLYYITTQPEKDNYYAQFRALVGKTLLLGLEILVAADIISTVAVEATFQNIAVLGLLVLIRTFLSWSLTVEIEGRWPWQRKGKGKSPNGTILGSSADAGDS